MRRFTCMTSVLALSAAFLSPVRAIAEDAIAAGETYQLSRLSQHSGTINPFYGDIDPFYGDIDPFYGDIDPFYGDIDPFYGDIDPFYGDINPFYGDISPFWGDIDPFWGDIDPFFGDIDAFWGDIDPFAGTIHPFWGKVGTYWGAVGPLWGDINSYWGDIDPFATNTQTSYRQVAAMLQDLVTRSEAVWGAAVLAATGQSFSAGFSDDVFGKYGIDLDDPASISSLTAADRSLFFLDWYDGLMNFSGVDHVDHWMPLVNWSPSLTQDQGGGTDAIVGLLDVKIPNIGVLGTSVEFVGGYDYSVNSHGISVAGLIAGAHDGQGVMGIAPDAKLLNYNPFDATGTASWDDVTTGILTLRANGATVINMSLGVAGWTLSNDWETVFANSSVAALTDTIFVKAAGNEGVVQTTDISSSSLSLYDNLIIVGSVDPTGSISYFSNTPGESCITTNSYCLEENKIKYRFMVAPGELILVNDNDGNLSRVSGTSFAAPLVTGAVTLLQDRWPWLQNYAEESVDILFQSARDLGDPGVDGTYGWGLLDVEASQSPLNFDNVVFYVPQSNAKYSYNKKNYDAWTSVSLKEALLAPGALALFEDQGAYLYAMEGIGDTFRDFTIPLSTKVYDQTFSADHRGERFQSHLYQRLIDWSTGGGFTDIESYSAPIVSFNGFSFDMAATPLDLADKSAGPDSKPFHSEVGVVHAETGFAFRMGSGTGATSLYQQEGFGFKSDYDIETGGVNPMLGFASGDAYASASLKVLRRTTMTLGFTNKDDNHITQDQVTGQDIDMLDGFENYQASAYTAGFDHVISDKLSISGSYALLNEETGLLGSQGKGALSLSGGSITDSMTLGVTAKPAEDLTLSASATVGHTRGTRYENSLLGVSDDGLQSTAFALSAYKQGLLGKEDGLRVTFMQPLHIESGDMEYRSIQVVDRQTGELGAVTETWGLNTSTRKLVTEVLYATPIMNNKLELNLFGEARFNDDEMEDDGTGWMLGFGLGGRF